MLDLDTIDYIIAIMITAKVTHPFKSSIKGIKIHPRSKKI